MDRSEYFVITAPRNIDYVITCLGCRLIDQCPTAEVAKFRDWLVEKGLASSSVKGAVNSDLESFEKAYLKAYSVGINQGNWY